MGKALFIWEFVFLPPPLPYRQQDDTDPLQNQLELSSNPSPAIPVLGHASTSSSGSASGDPCTVPSRTGCGRSGTARPPRPGPKDPGGFHCAPWKVWSRGSYPPRQGSDFPETTAVRGSPAVKRLSGEMERGRERKRGSASPQLCPLPQASQGRSHHGRPVESNQQVSPAHPRCDPGESHPSQSSQPTER